MTILLVVVIGQILVALSCIVGYVVMTVLGFDGTPLLTVLVGQGIGAGLQLAYQQVTSNQEKDKPMTGAVTAPGA